jgi:transglutaminase-like putative cysteine protease
MKIEICHVTRYMYGEPVADSVNELRLTPRTDERQACYQHQVTVEPAASLFAYEDYFGNRVHAFSVNKPHLELVIKSRSTVVTSELSAEGSGAAGPVLALGEELAVLADESVQDRFAEYLLQTQYTEATDELRSYATRCPLGDDGVYAWALRLMKAIRGDFRYDPEATHVLTTVSEMLQLGRGVCQDFTHLMLSVCRMHGVPSRYVSGYHFVGDLQGGSADFEQASHAWVEIWIPGRGWSGFDPTNDAEIDWRYVKLGHGRDYKDIVPVKGVYRGTGNQRLEVKVDVRRTAD